MRTGLVLVAALAVAGSALAQTSTCSTYGRTTYCDMAPPPDQSAMQNGAAMFGAALGTKLAQKRKEKQLATVLESKRQCLSTSGAPVMKAYQDCVEQNAARLASANEPATVTVDAAKAMCRQQEGALSDVVASCGASEIYPRVMDMSREDALAKILTLRSSAQR